MPSSAPRWRGTAATVCKARAAWVKNKSCITSGWAAKIGRTASGTVNVTRKYGTGRSRSVCCRVHAAVPAPPQRGHDR
jgi:hypothetical protein